MTLRNFVKAECAYQTMAGCRVRPRCSVLGSKRCGYFEHFVLPLAPKYPGVADEYAAIEAQDRVRRARMP